MVLNIHNYLAHFAQPGNGFETLDVSMEARNPAVKSKADPHVGMCCCSFGRLDQAGPESSLKPQDYL
jgi:hypothetical protein